MSLKIVKRFQLFLTTGVDFSEIICLKIRPTVKRYGKIDGLVGLYVLR